VYYYKRNTNNKFDGELIKFESRSPKGKYNIIAACAIQPLKKKADSYPDMVLCIDSSNKDLGVLNTHREYIALMIVSLSTIIAIAQASMGVKEQHLEDWIKKMNHG